MGVVTMYGGVVYIAYLSSKVPSIEGYGLVVLVLLFERAAPFSQFNADRGDLLYCGRGF